ncbi:hypothetical protein VNO78_20753 [Psophocarpus tetragonolobus]|uniref:Beta-glucosidase n=1 Tax=Psophocarpus tetragonolobus TaxID=3891 RepID=A0AAN9XHG3_PSOTE
MGNYIGKDVHDFVDYKLILQDKQHGFIGISIYTIGTFPATNTEKDRVATQRVHDFFVGWIMEPLLHGDYPISMKRIIGKRIPTFTNHESEQVKGQITHHFLVLTDGPDLVTNEEYPITPWGLRDELDKFKLLYGNPTVFIYENGQRTASNLSLQDVSRVKYLHGYIGGVLDALRNGSNVKGYFAWSFIDVLELLDGYKSSFGLYYVDRNDPELKRYPKLSAKWYNRFLRARSTSIVGTIELEKDQSLVFIDHLFE